MLGIAPLYHLATKRLKLIFTGAGAAEGITLLWISPDGGRLIKVTVFSSKKSVSLNTSIRAVPGLSFRYMYSVTAAA